MEELLTARRIQYADRARVPCFLILPGEHSDTLKYQQTGISAF
jgi:hypothetical protein